MLEGKAFSALHRLPPFSSAFIDHVSGCISSPKPIRLHIYSASLNQCFTVTNLPVLCRWHLFLRLMVFLHLQPFHSRFRVTVRYAFVHLTISHVEGSWGVHDTVGYFLYIDASPSERLNKAMRNYIKLIFFEEKTHFKWASETQIMNSSAVTTLEWAKLKETLNQNKVKRVHVLAWRI